jgi:hypothetical protein
MQIKNVQLNHTIVKGSAYPWSYRVKGQALDASGLALEFSQHVVVVEMLFMR